MGRGNSSSQLCGWVIPAFDENDAEKAIILAGSLRRVKTRGKLIVITGSGVPEKIRNHLYQSFDLVNIMDMTEGNRSSDLENRAKVFAFSLGLFTCCVYLPPNSLVLKNCDEIFSLENFIGLPRNLIVEKKSSLFVFKPDSRHFQALQENLARASVKNGGTDVFAKAVSAYAKMNKLNLGELEERYFHELQFSTSGNVKQFGGGIDNLTLVNFGTADLKSIRKDNPSYRIGLVESFVLDLWWTVYHNEIYLARHSSNSNSSLSSSSVPVPTKDDMDDPVAIVGMSCRFPGGANNVDEFWKLLIESDLIEGKEGIIEIPSHRWVKGQTIVAACPKSRKTKGGFLDFPVDEFDSNFFNISQKDAEYVDPQTRLLLECSYECLEMAAINPQSLNGTNSGVFVGSWLHDYKDMTVKKADRDFYRIFMGSETATRLSFFYGISGPSVNSESGCSSAILAVHNACRSLRSHETGFCLAAGVNLFLHPFNHGTMSFVLAPDGRCKTFDDSADGFGRAEGCAVLAMKRLSDAVRDGDNIWGLIRGSAITQEGTSKSMGTPTVHSESLAMELALKDAGVNPLEVSYIETHGTGTPVGDPMEIAAITKAYSKGRTEPVVLGSVKTNIGHTESVSGIAGIIKTLLSMKNDTIPRHLNFTKLNPEINLSLIPAEIPLRHTEWKRKGCRIAGVSSFGISGTDGHVILQEPPKDYEKENTIDLKLSRPLHIMQISGKTPEALDTLLDHYENFLETSRESLENIAYTANVGRATFANRAIIIANDKEKAVKALKAKTFMRKDGLVGVNAKLCFLFTGQGCQYPNMAQTLYETSPVFNYYFDYCDRILQSDYGIQLKSILWEDSGELNRSLYSQTAIFVVEYCLLKLWESWNVKPDYVLGHSLGEFAAAVAAGVLTFRDALMLVAERSRLIDNLPRGKMLVVKADQNTVNETILAYQQNNKEFWVDYAAVNSQDQVVISGDSKMIEEFSKYCVSRSLKTIVLAATHAFHSRHMEPMLEEYREIALTVKRPLQGDSPPQYISGVEGKLIDPNSIDAEYWVRHTREKVSFIDACKAIQSEGCTLFLEVGPHPVLSALAMMNIEETILCLPSLYRRREEWSTMLDSLGKLHLSDWKGEIDWKRFDQYYGRKKISNLPFHPFFRKKIWIDFRSTPGKIHPLVGRLIPNASKATIFENEITLNQINYLRDHTISNIFIFPGAALLEMCVVAGYCGVQGMFENFSKPRRPITVNNLRIEAPLPLYEGRTTVLQTVIDLNENEKTPKNGEEHQVGYLVKIHNWFGNNDPSQATHGYDLVDGQWKTHASAYFLPLVTEDPLAFISENLEQIKDTWEKVSAAKEFYERLPEVGLCFGPTFQSLVCGWKEHPKKDSEGAILFQVKVPSDDHESYMVHPVILDAMLQASMIWMSKERLHKKLHVPVSIQEFTWVAEGKEDGERYVYCSTSEGISENEQGKLKTFLLDGTGKILAYMTGVEFIETTVKLVESVIQQQSYTMPQMWEEIWKVKPGALQGTGTTKPVENVKNDDELSTEVLQACRKLNDLDEDELKVYRHLDNLTLLYFLNALYKLGWKPEVGDKLQLKSFMEQFGIIETMWNYIKYFFFEMSKEKFVEKVDHPEEEDCYVIRNLPGSKEDVEMLCEQIVAEGETLRGDYRILSEMGKRLAEFLSGKESPLNVLFPEDPKKPSMGSFYDTIRPYVSETGNILNNAFSHYKHLFYTRESKGATLRILEVGGGTGSGTKDYLDFLESKQINFEFSFTDISAAFFTNAGKKFEKFKEVMRYKKLDIDYDPLAQGFTPGYYDIILACEVLHAAKDIRKTLAYLRTLLKTNGHIQITETTKRDRRINLIVGLLEGYWRRTDHDLRPYHPTMPSEQWCEVLNECGYNSAGSIGCYYDVHSYIFAVGSEDYSIETGSKGMFEHDWCKTRDTSHDQRYFWLVFCDGSDFSLEIQKRLKCLNRGVVAMEETESDNQNGGEKIARALKELEGDYFEGILYLWNLSHRKDLLHVTLPFLQLSQKVLELNKITARLYLITQGAYIIQEDSSCPHPDFSTVWGIAKTLRNEQPNLSMNCLDLSPETSLIGQVNEAFYELFWADTEELIAYREGKRLVPRLASVKILDDALKLPSFCDRFQLILPETKAISDLEFGFLNKYKLKEDEIEVEIKAAALNFRDIFAVLKPTEQFDKINSIGSDFAGVVSNIGEGVKKWKVGDHVFGMNTEQQALPSHVKTKENMVIRVPDKFTFPEAATIPAVFATALYCLVSIAKIKKGDVVLIHTASGGVGLSAIQIAQHFGADIIATAGSRRKRAYLKSLGIKHVFHSRNTEYEKDIMEATGGRGVDIVLNSLTGPGFKEASLNVCAKQAKFVEMSKLNIWKPEEVRALREDVEYTIADLTSLEEDEWKDLLEKMMKSMEENFVRPIPYMRFDALNIRQALGFLQKAKHLGKVLCTMPETKSILGKGKHDSTPKSKLFNAESTYLITGGLGGIGFEVAKWMITTQGAKNLLLVSRSPPKPEVMKIIESWNEDGSRKVEAWQVDVGNRDQVKKMFERLLDNGWPPLRGVMHVAGVIQDGTIPNQTWEKFEKTYNAKVVGTINLHECTKDLRLEHFVLFSSVTSLFGSPGQANHTASNCFEDAFAQYRYSMGLPAATINWANWGEVGVAQDIDFPGIRPIATSQGMRALEAVLQSNRLQTCVMNVDSFGLVAKLFPKIKGYVDDKRLLGDLKVTVIINPEKFWKDVDKAEGRESKIDVFKTYIKNMLRTTLKMDPDEIIDDNTEFQALGVDSLMLLEMKNYLQNLFGSRLMLTATHLKDCNSAGTLATKLVSLLEKRNNSEGNVTDGQDAPVGELPNAESNFEMKNNMAPEAIMVE